MAERKIIFRWNYPSVLRQDLSVEANTLPLHHSTQEVQKLQSPTPGQTVEKVNSTDPTINSVRPPPTPVSPQPSVVVLLANPLVPLWHNLLPKKELSGPEVAFFLSLGENILMLFYQVPCIKADRPETTSLKWICKQKNHSPGPPIFNHVQAIQTPPLHFSISLIEFGRKTFIPVWKRII